MINDEEDLFDKNSNDPPKVFTFRFDKMKKDEKIKFQDLISKYGEELSDDEHTSQDTSEDN